MTTPRARCAPSSEVLSPACSPAILRASTVVPPSRDSVELTSVPDDPPKRHWLRPLGVAVAVGLLALTWSSTPLASYLEPERLIALWDDLAQHPLGPVVYAGFMGLATLLMAPVTALFLVAGLLFGPLVGLVSGLAGAMISAVVGWLLGRHCFGELVRRHRRCDAMARTFARGGLLSTTILHLTPITPFTVVNLVAGSAALRARDFLAGTLLGLLPSAVGLTFAADRVAAAAKTADTSGIALTAAILVAITTVLMLVRRWAARRNRAIEPPPTAGRFPTGFEPVRSLAPSCVLPSATIH